LTNAVTIDSVLQSLSGMGMAELLQVDPNSSVYSLLALSDADLERVDVVVLNLAVARGIKSLQHLDVQRYIDVIDDWTKQFADFLPECEARNFNRFPERFHNDVHFFRMGALAGFLGSHIGIAYIEEQRNLEKIAYTDPSHLFINGVIDTKRGTCGNLAALHVSIARRLGWPVAICSAGSHWLSKYDDGKVKHTIETSKIGIPGFDVKPDSWYMEHFKFPHKGVLCGSELRKLSAREMLGAFVASRGRHHTDIRRPQTADLDYSLARHLLPNHRKTHMRACATMVKLSVNLFEPNEVGHMNTLFEDLAPVMAPDLYAQREKLYARQPPEGIVNFVNPFAGNYSQTVVAAGCFSPKKIEVKTERMQ
jgi:hypothetical protein